MHANRPLSGFSVAAAAAIAVAALATGCGDATSHDGGHTTSPSAAAGSSPAALHNQADISFAQGMIPHHQQAVEMAEVASSRAGDPQVKALAADIAAAQGPEIETMTTWLTEWGAPLPTEDPDPHGGAHGEAHDMPGMMTGQEMAALADAEGDQFDRMFLEMMIRHHEGAVEMAAIEQQQGRHPAAKALAEKIHADQTSEIALMRDLLDGR
ncbi:DUF305 domain-containing protein [Solwaraspora sp. WMMD791]|uniref:DUF305 domain-containing protein n=1 Tax=Solwaraspora sp. WMMD791 TaxID=3016086 RepID=UPI00249B8AAC|nr:DUF305 domain-containing protein [Solwaraspora sp. WMMD791]WFE27003.1 DUF305 domain-containing protein [Solwaraspora sp. WMMD791]